MLVINRSLVTLNEGKLVAEASTIGLVPGDWPMFISVVDDAGSGFLFTKGAAFQTNHDDSEFGGYHYFTRAGQQFVVFND